MTQNERVRAVERADKIDLGSRAAMIVEFDQEGGLHIATYGSPLGCFYMKKALKKQLNNE